MDTQNTVKEILASGVTQSELAAQLKCSQALISAYANGKRGTNLRYDIGQRLEAYYKKLSRKRGLTALPP